MAVSVTGKTVFSTNGFTPAADFTTPSASYISGRRIWVIAHAQEYFHDTGFSWAISDDASTNSITWNAAGTSSEDESEGSNLGTQVQVWYSSELTANESFTITVDPNDGSGNSYLGALLVFETTDNDGSLEQTIVFDIATSNNSNTINFGSSPSLTQVVACFSNVDSATSDWDAAPTNWSKVTNCEADGDTGNGQAACALLIDSTTNTSTGVTQTIDAPGTTPSYWMVALEFAETGVKTGSGNAAIAVATAASGNKSTTGSGDAPVNVAASASGNKSTTQSGSAAIAVTASASGNKIRYGSGNATIGIAASATGAKQVTGSGNLFTDVTTRAVGYNATTPISATPAPNGFWKSSGYSEVTFTPGSATAVDADLDILWDIDGDGDFSEDIENITSYVQETEILVGKDFPSQATGRASPGKCKLRLNNENNEFNYFNDNSSFNQFGNDLKSLAGGKLRVQIEDATAPEPTLLAYDRFNGSTSPSTTEDGKTWNTTGTWDQSNGYATNSSSGFLTTDLSVTEAYFQAYFADPYVCGLIYRFTDSNNYGYIRLFGGSLTTRTVIAGVSNTISTVSVANRRPKYIGAYVDSDDNLYVYIDGVLVNTDSGTAYSGSGTEFGVYVQTNTLGSTRIGEFYAWDRIWNETTGILFTGDVSRIHPSSVLGGPSYAVLEAEGWLAKLAAPKIVPPLSLGVTDYVGTGVTSGLMIGHTLGKAGLLHPPVNGGLDAGAVTLGSVGLPNGKALNIARQFESIEYGFLHETPEGPIAFDDRNSRVGVSPLASISDSKKDQFRYSAIEMLNMNQEVFNIVEAEVSPVMPSIAYDNDVTSTDVTAGNTVTITVTLPSSGSITAGQLYLVGILTTGLIPGDQFTTPPGWTELKPRGQSIGAQRWYAKKIEADDYSASYTFYTASSTGGGGYTIHELAIDNWYGAIESGVAIAEPTGYGDGTISAAQAGTNNPPTLLVPWGRQATLFICTRSGAHTSTSGSQSMSIPSDLPQDYVDGGTEYLATSVSTDDLCYQYGYREGVTTVESPTSFEGTLSGFDYLDVNLLAIRGYCGDPPEDSSGEIITIEDADLQISQNRLATYPSSGEFFKDSSDATDYGEFVIANQKFDQPRFRIGYWAHKNYHYRRLAYSRRLSDQIRLVGDGAAGHGINDKYHIDSIRHVISNSAKTWWVEYELSPEIVVPA